MGGGRRLSHPRLFARGTDGAVAQLRTGVRTIVYAPSSRRQPWIENEVRRAGAMLQIGRGIEHIVLALTDDPPPRPQMLVVDIDSISGAELLRLHAVRDGAWFGTIVALGVVPPALRGSLGIARVLEAPFVEGALVEMLERHSIDTEAITVPMPFTR